MLSSTPGLDRNESSTLNRARAICRYMNNNEGFRPVITLLFKMQPSLTHVRSPPAYHYIVV